MLALLISKIRLPSVLTTLSRAPLVVTSSVKRKFSEISKPAVQDLAKDVMIYKYDNIRKFRLLNLFAISQLFFWVYLGQWSYSGMKDTKVRKIVNWMLLVKNPINCRLMSLKLMMTRRGIRQLI